jgi:hypothetical protein
MSGLDPDALEPRAAPESFAPARKLGAARLNQSSQSSSLSFLGRYVLVR